MDKLLWKCWLDLQVSRKSKMAAAVGHFANLTYNNETYEVQITFCDDFIRVEPTDDSRYQSFRITQINLKGVYQETPTSNIVLNGNFGSLKLEFDNQFTFKCTLEFLQNLISDQSKGSDSPPPSSESE